MLTEDGYWLPEGAVRGIPRGKLARFVHPRDYRIAFREHDHRYFILGRSEEETAELSKNLMSVSGVLKMFEEEFDAPSKAAAKVRKDGRKLLSDPKYRDLLKGLPEHEWARAMEQMWARDGEQSRQQGKEMHACLEDHLNGDPPRFPLTEQHYHMLAFLDEAKAKWGVVPIRAEWNLYSDRIPGVPSESAVGPVPAEPYFMAGSADLVMAPESQVESGKITHLLLGDWKRCKGIEVRCKWRNLKHELSAFWDSNFCTYTLQLNTYRWYLESYYNFTLIGMHKIVAHPNEIERPLVQHVDHQQGAVQLLLRRRMMLMRVQ
jgi:hypothetical protein